MSSSFTGQSGCLNPGALSEEELNDRRKKALERFERPEETPMEIVEEKKVISESNRIEKERIAKLREENLIRNQQELDRTEVRVAEPAVQKPDEEKRKRCLTGLSKAKEIRKELKEDGINLIPFLREGNTDFSIVCPDGKICVHREVLAARSAYFGTLLSSDCIEGRLGEVQLDFSEECVNSFVEYVYSGVVRTSNTSILELVYLADFLKQEPLKYLLQIKLCEFVSAENLIDLINLADELKLWFLREKCEDLIKTDKEGRKVYNEYKKRAFS